MLSKKLFILLIFGVSSLQIGLGFIAGRIRRDTWANEWDYYPIQEREMKDVHHNPAYLWHGANETQTMWMGAYEPRIMEHLTPNHDHLTNAQNAYRNTLQWFRLEG